MDRFTVAVDGAGANRALVAQELSNAVHAGDEDMDDIPVLMAPFVRNT